MPSALLFRIPRNRVVDLVFAFLAICVAVFTVVCGQHEFGAYDSSMLIDAGWRMANGQLPGRDFPNTLPPSFLLLAGAAVRVFHAKWYAFTVTGSLFYLCLAATGWAMVRLSKLTTGATGILVAYLVGISMPHLITGHLWHAVVASLFAIAFLLFLTLSSLLAEQRWASRSRHIAWFALGIFASAGLWASKPNIALVTFASSMLIPLVRARRRAWRDWMIATLGGLVAAVGAVRLCGMHPLAIAHEYGTVSERPAPFKLLYIFFNRAEMPSTHIDTALVYSFAIAVPVLLLAQFWLHRHAAALRTLAPVAVCGILITAAGLLTNWDVRGNDLGAITFVAALTLGTLLVHKTKLQQALQTALVVFCVQAVVLCAFDCLHRTRMIAVGPWAGIAFGDISSPRGDPFFGKFSARVAFWSDLDKIDSDLKQHAHDRIFFGPRLEFEYARNGLPSPWGLPIWWHPGSSYPVSMEAELTRRWLARDYQTVYATDVERLPSGIANALKRDYIHETRANVPLPVYRKRDSVAPPDPQTTNAANPSAAAAAFPNPSQKPASPQAKTR